MLFRKNAENEAMIAEALGKMPHWLCDGALVLTKGESIREDTMLLDFLTPLRDTFYYLQTSELWEMVALFSSDPVQRAKAARSIQQLQKEHPWRTSFKQALSVLRTSLSLKRKDCVVTVWYD